MGRRQGLKQGRPAQLLLRSLTTEEVLRILRAGEIEANSNARLFQQLADGLELVKGAFLDGMDWRSFGMTDRQLTGRLTVVRNQARELAAILDDTTLQNSGSSPCGRQR